MNEIILASASPRRKELLAQIGLPFQVCVSDCRESITETLPERVVCELSRQKARDVWQKMKKGIVIGADTVVAYGGRILGKPADTEQAVEMLTLLAGNTHQVYTGVTFCYQENGAEKEHTFYEMTKVTVYPMSREEITAYVETGEPMDKAGAYGIQGRFAAYVKEIHGDYNNVVGLPVGRLYQELKDCR